MRPDYGDTCDFDSDGSPLPPLEYLTPVMSLRDWFAGQAMQARLSGTNLPRLDIRHAIAADAYAIADAMLAAREAPDASAS